MLRGGAVCPGPCSQGPTELGCRSLQPARSDCHCLPLEWFFAHFFANTLARILTWLRGQGLSCVYMPGLCHVYTCRGWGVQRGSPAQRWLTCVLTRTQAPCPASVLLPTGGFKFSAEKLASEQRTRARPGGGFSAVSCYLEAES